MRNLNEHWRKIAEMLPEGVDHSTARQFFFMGAAAAVIETKRRVDVNDLALEIDAVRQELPDVTKH